MMFTAREHNRAIRWSTLAQHYAVIHSALKAATLAGLVLRNVAALVIGKPQRERSRRLGAQLLGGRRDSGASRGGQAGGATARGAVCAGARRRRPQERTLRLCSGPISISRKGPSVS